MGRACNRSNFTWNIVYSSCTACLCATKLSHGTGACFATTCDGDTGWGATMHISNCYCIMVTSWLSKCWDFAGVRRPFWMKSLVNQNIRNHRYLEKLARKQLLNCLFWRRSNKTSKLRVTGICEGNPLVAGGFPSQRASNAENVSIWWRHHEARICFFH